MSRKLYPIGIQTFERIRKEDMLYVDKTEYVYHMTHTDGKYFSLADRADSASRFLCPHCTAILRASASCSTGLP